MMGDYTLRQLISDPTRVADTQTCIDLMFTNVIHINSYGVANINISDHFPIFMRLKCDKILYNMRSFKGRSYRNYDQHIFTNAFAAVDWLPFDTSEDIDFCWEFYLEKTIKYSRHLLPYKNFFN